MSEEQQRTLNRYGFETGNTAESRLIAENRRIAAVSVVVENPDSVEALNAVLHGYAAYILGRMGIPYREKEISIICVALDAPMDVINTLTGRLGRLPGVSAKATVSRRPASSEQPR